MLVDAPGYASIALTLVIILALSEYGTMEHLIEFDCCSHSLQKFRYKQRSRVSANWEHNSARKDLGSIPAGCPQHRRKQLPFSSPNTNLIEP